MTEAAGIVRSLPVGSGQPEIPEIIATLGSVCDPTLVAEVLALHNIQCIYHAAAYKHVSIVEQNPFVGVGLSYIWR